MRSMKKWWLLMVANLKAPDARVWRISDAQASSRNQRVRKSRDDDRQWGQTGVMDLDHDVSNDVRKAIAALETNIKTRILY